MPDNISPEKSALPRLMAALPFLVGLILCCLPVSCTVHPVDEKPDVDVTLPAAFSASGQAQTAGNRWWQAFQDIGLNNLVEQVLADNLDMAQAWDRLAQAEAAARLAGASLQPQVSIQAGASRAKTVSTSSFIPTRTRNSFFFNPTLSYEIDLWGRIRSSRNAGIMDMNASRKDLESTAITLAALTAQTWYSLAEQAMTLAMLDEQLATNAKLLKLVKLRFAQGKTSAVSVYQQAQQLAQTETRIPPVKAQMALLEHELALLMGQGPSAKLPDVMQTLPELPPLPATGLPLAILKQRPDVRAMEQRAVAADYRLASALADRLPKLSFGAGLSWQSDKLHNLFDDWAWNIAGNLLQPLIDGGMRKAEIDRNRAVLQERLHGFAKAMLNAIKEVEDALTRERSQKDYLDRLDSQVAIVEKNFQAAQNRFLNGQSDYLPVLSALNLLQSLKIQAITGQSRLIQHRIQLYKALGGTWPGTLSPPPAEAQTSGGLET